MIEIKKEDYYIPLIAFDTEKEVRVILKHLSMEVTGKIVKLNKRQYERLKRKGRGGENE